MLGISVDFNGANQAWAEKIGLTYPLLSDVRRVMSRAYGVLNEDLTAANDPKRIFSYFRTKRAWFIIDKTGVVRYTRLDNPQGLVPSDEMLAVIEKYK